jgi:preprotein translocase subunit Sec63
MFVDRRDVMFEKMYVDVSEIWMTVDEEKVRSDLKQYTDPDVAIENLKAHPGQAVERTMFALYRYIPVGQ